MKLVDDSGWRGARLQEFRAEIYSSLKSLLGTISSEADSVIGQLIAVIAEDDTQISESMGWIFCGFFISMAENIQLDGIGESMGLRRYGLTQSKARVVYLLEQGKQVNAGDTFTVEGIEGDWGVSALVVGDAHQSTGVILAVKDSALVAGNVFVITINGISYTTDFETGDTSTSVISRIFGLAIAGNTSLSTMPTAHGNMLFHADGASTATFAFSEDVFDIIRAGMPATAFYQSQSEFPTVDYGDVISDDILALAAGSKGFLIESDDDYRVRLQARANARSIGVGASRPGIKASVLAVDGVGYCSVNTNRGIETNADGLPGKSVQVFVAGGDDDAVAQAIWNAVAGEAATFGTSFGTATDGDVTETMYFSRREYQLIYVALSAPVWDAETGGQPNDYYTVARTVVDDYFSNIPVGRDVFANQIYARLLTAFPSLTDIDVAVGLKSSPTGKTVSVPDGVVAVTSADAITIEGEK
ncbi:TPA: baseplate protein [Serratia marcescens]